MTGERAYLEKAIGRYSPQVAATARAGLKKLHARFPGARQLVYERRQSLPIGFGPAERGGAAFSLVLYPSSVRVDEEARLFDDPYVCELMPQAVTLLVAANGRWRLAS